MWQRPNRCAAIPLGHCSISYSKWILHISSVSVSYVVSLWISNMLQLIRIQYGSRYTKSRLFLLIWIKLPLEIARGAAPMTTIGHYNLQCRHWRRSWQSSNSSVYPFIPAVIIAVAWWLLRNVTTNGRVCMIYTHIIWIIYCDIQIFKLA